MSFYILFSAAVLLPQLTRRATLTDDSNIYHGTPISLQLVGRKLQEEKVLAIGEVVERALREFHEERGRERRL